MMLLLSLSHMNCYICMCMCVCAHTLDLWASQLALVVNDPPASVGVVKIHGFNHWIWKVPWRRAWQPTPVFLPGESHGQRSLEGYTPQGWKELGMPEATEHTCTHVVVCCAFVCLSGYICVYVFFFCVCVHVCEYVHTYIQEIVEDKDSQYFQSELIAIMFTNNNTGYFRIVRF